MDLAPPWDPFWVAHMVASYRHDALLAVVARHGYATGYRGLRVAKSGRRFWIEDVTVWNVLDENGRRIGQAATYMHTTAA